MSRPMAVAMVKGEAKALLEGYRSALRDGMSRFDEVSLLKLRGELQVASRWLEAHKDAARAKTADAALHAVSRLYEFTVEVRGFASSRQAAEAASMFDIGSVGVLAVENVLTAEKVTPIRLLMSGLSESLMFLASRQYVKGSNALLDATYRTHALAIQDALWSLAADFREADDLGAIRKARTAIDSLFASLARPEVPLGARVVVLYQLYALVALVRCALFLEDLEGLR